MSDTNVHRVVGNLLVGTSHFFVDTTTNQVGVNTSTPSAALDIATGDLKVGSGITIGNNGTITATNFSGNGSGLNGINSDSGSWVKDDANGLVYVANSTHKVGIGLTSPDEKLDIDGGNIRLRSTGTAKIFNHSAGSDYGNLQISSGYQNAAAAPKIDLIGWTGAGTVDGDNLIKFSTNNSVRMCINQSGNVGVGTTSPLSRLHVGDGSNPPAGTVDADASLTLDGAGRKKVEQGKPGIYHRENVGLGLHSDYKMSFEVGGSSTLVEAMRILDNGNLGVGTMNPSSKLTINQEPEHDGAFDFSDIPLQVNYNSVVTSSSTLNDPKTVMLLTREGTNGESYAAGAGFRLSRWENDGVNSRSRLDIDLKDGSFDLTNVMTLKSDGSVGIPTASEFKLDVSGSDTNGRSLALRSGDTSSGTDSIQILLGYANTLEYAHSIRTRHNSSNGDNAIDFWCWNNSVASGTYGNKRIMRVESAYINNTHEGLVTVDGIIKPTNQPRWCWYGGGNSNWTNVGYLTYSHDMVTQDSISGSPSLGYATAQIAGVYFVSWCAFMESTVNAANVQYEIRKNNNGFIRNYHASPIQNYSATGGLQCLIHLDVGDHVRVYINYSVHANANSCFCGFLVA